MNIIETAIPGVLIVEPVVHGDARGYFVETWQQKRYAGSGLPNRFVQDNLARSQQGVLRGLHVQNPFSQGKLVQVLWGEVYDVAVDVRRGSPYFGRWVGVTLSDRNKRQFYVPEGFAHGYCVTSDSALFAYKCTEYYHPEAEFSLLWNDPDIGIQWPLRDPLVSAKDRAALRLRDVPTDRLPGFNPN